jgi:predicted DsbA family dithiol-disulfide isomerase
VTAAADRARLVEVYAEVTCPFAHYSLRRFRERRRLAGAEHVRLRVRAWPLELVNGEPLAADTVAGEIADLRAQVAPDLFSGFSPLNMPASTIAVLGTATLAYAGGVEVGEAFSFAVRDALFEEGRPIGDPDVLADVAGEHGVEVPDEAAARAAVEADLEEGRRQGVVGSPHFVVDGTPFFCPTLDIERRGPHLHIDVDDVGWHRFIERLLG